MGFGVLFAICKTSLLMSLILSVAVSTSVETLLIPDSNFPNALTALIDHAVMPASAAVPVIDIFLKVFLFFSAKSVIFELIALRFLLALSTAFTMICILLFFIVLFGF